MSVRKVGRRGILPKAFPDFVAHASGLVMCQAIWRFKAKGPVEAVEEAKRFDWRRLTTDPTVSAQYMREQIYEPRLDAVDRVTFHEKSATWKSVPILEGGFAWPDGRVWKPDAFRVLAKLASVETDDVKLQALVEEARQLLMRGT